MRRVSRGAAVACACSLLTIAHESSRAQNPTSSTYPIDLATALRLVDAQNLDVQIARERVKEALANRMSAIEQFIPWLAPGVTWHRRDGVAQASPSGIIGNAGYVGYSPGFSLNAQSTLGDAIYNSLATKQLIRASNEGLAALRLEAAGQAANGYLELAKAKGLVEVVRDALATSEEYQRQLHDAVGAGIAFKGDELRVQAQSQHYQVLLRQALSQQRVAAVELARILHLDASVELTPQAGDLVPIVLFDSTLTVESLVNRAVQSRPEMRQNDALIAAGRTARDAAVYGPLVPTVGAQLFGGWLGGGPDSASRRVASMRDYALAITWRIGPGGLFDRGRIDATKAQLAQREVNTTKVKDGIAAEVVADLTRIRALSDQIAISELALGTATQTLQLTRDRKQFGVGIVLEDIQAQQAVTQARSDYITAIAEFNKAQFALNKAVGGSASDAAAARP